MGRKLSASGGDPWGRVAWAAQWDIAVPDWDIADVVLLSLLTSWSGHWPKFGGILWGGSLAPAGGTRAGALRGAAQWEIAVLDWDIADVVLVSLLKSRDV